MLGKFFLFISLSIIPLSASVTMCYKENITSPSKAEKAKLDGGKCAGTYSAQEMKANGWKIKDVVFSKGESGLNYTYLFEKTSIQTVNVDNEINAAIAPTQNITNEELKAKIRAAQAEVKKEDEAKARADVIEIGKNIYISKCQSCHGNNGEKEPSTSTKLLGMDSGTFEASMRDYALGEKDKGAALLMKPYLLLEDEYLAVSAYLQQIKILEKSKEEESIWQKMGLQ